METMVTVGGWLLLVLLAEGLFALAVARMIAYGHAATSHCHHRPSRSLPLSGRPFAPRAHHSRPG
jgi:hypothetical protein